MSAVSIGVVPSGEYLLDEGLVWLVGVVVLASCTVGPVAYCAIAPLALANQLPLPRL